MTDIPDTLHSSPLDRVLQRKLLMLMSDVYPTGISEIHALVDSDEHLVVANLHYLEEHGLCHANLTAVCEEGYEGYDIGDAKIKADGLDFLADDGGLSAILGVVTIKVHADYIKDMLNEKIESVPISSEEKSKFKNAIAKLHGTALNAATTELAKAGIDHIPDALHFLRQVLGL